MNRRFSLAEIAGLGAFAAAGLLAGADLQLAAVPLGAFVILCMTAPFLPWFGFFLPVVIRGNRRRKAVALTFDDGPDPRVTYPLLNLLDRYGVKAAFFVVGRKAEAHPELIREMLTRGHAIGNHSFHHDNLLMLRNTERLRREILSAQKALQRFGIRPLAFRPPVGVTSPRLGPVLSAAGLIAVNYSRRGGDFGNRRIRRLSEKILNKVRPGDIILLHDVAPAGENGPLRLLTEVERMLIGLKRKELAVIPLSELIQRSVMAAPPSGL